MRAKIFFPLLVVLFLGLFPVQYKLYNAAQCIGNRISCPFGMNRLEAYAFVLEMQPWRTELWQQAGSAAYAVQDWDSAKMLLTTAAENKALDRQGQQLLAEVLLNSGDTQAGIEQMLILMDEKQLSTQGHRRLYELLLSDFRIEEAEQVAQAWLQKEPRSADAQLFLGLLQLSRDHFEALHNLELASALDGNLQPLVRDLDLAIAQAHLSDDAAYQQLLIGRELANQGHTVYAEILCAQAVKINPQYAEAWAMLGELQQQNGRSDGFEALETAIQLSPESALVQSLMAVYWQRKGDPSQAVTYYQQLTAQQPEEFRWQVELAKATADTGDIPAGYEIILEMQDHFPDEIQALIETANFCAIYGMDVDTVGLSAARDALAQEPESTAAMTAMGNVLFALSDFDSAQRYYQRALDLEPQNAQLHFLLGKVYLKKEQTTLAMYHLELAHALAPNYSVLAVQIERTMESLQNP